MSDANSLGQLIELYLETRDAKQALERKQKAHLKKYSDVLTRIEGKFLEHLQANGGQAFSTSFATAYLTTKRSAPITDAVAFKGYVIENRAWDMLDWKANVTAVSDFVNDHEELPPGVSLKAHVTVNIARK